MRAVVLWRGTKTDCYCKVVNPDKEKGRVTLITRYGAAKVCPGYTLCISVTHFFQIDAHLSSHIIAVQSSKHPVAWICDPMHGKYVSYMYPPKNACSNPYTSTQTSASGLKTRQFSDIISELTSCLHIHAATHSVLNGVSLEFTGELNEEGFSVTECLGGSMELSEEELGLRYQVCYTS